MAQDIPIAAQRDRFRKFRLKKMIDEGIDIGFSEAAFQKWLKEQETPKPKDKDTEKSKT